MTGLGPNSYDDLPYITHTHPSLHPDRLATLAILHGMTPVPVDRCRVLELGCGDGTNVIGLAYALPESEFVGVDFAANAIRRGQAAVTALGLANMRLDCGDILGFPADAGEFDYVIAHGLYSWVPPAVRDGALRICQNHLAPNGVAYVSYNCLPGGHVRRAIREMLLVHVRDITDPVARVRAAREFARFLLAADRRESAQPGLYKEELQRIVDGPDYTIRHDDLAEVNDPVYFHEFVAHAGRFDLQFLADADFSSMQIARLPDEVVSVVRAIPDSDVVMRQQYLDFALARTFRKTLLCRADVILARDLDAGVLERLYVAADLRPVPDQPELHTDSVVEFRTGGGVQVQAAEPLVKTAFALLGECWPGARQVVELADAALWRLAGGGPSPLTDDASTPDAHRQLQEVLLQAYSVKVVDLYTMAPRLLAAASERPRVSRLAHWMASSMGYVVTLSHRTVQLEGATIRNLMSLCDGTRARDELRRALEQLEAEPGNVTADDLERGLATLARMGVLEA